MENKIVFFNTGWMQQYKGLKGDKLTGGGKYVLKNKWGGEIFNFKNSIGTLYGYVQPTYKRGSVKAANIKLERLGGRAEDDQLKNITVVWTATDPRTRGTYIIGWYKNATVHRYYKDPSKSSGRKFKGELVSYIVTAKTKDATLLHVDERNMLVKRKAKNWMGQSNVWYAEKNPAFVEKVRKYIFQGINPAVKKRNTSKGTPRQIDVLKRLEVERNAIIAVSKHYSNLGYKIRSVEKDNVGWDLIASNQKSELKLEVKGLSGDNLIAELTPNEYLALKANKGFYRICIVTQSLTKPKLHIFMYSEEDSDWVSEDGTVLNIDKITSARVFV